MNPELQNSIASLVNTINTGAKGAGSVLQNIGPEAWRIAVRQVQIEALACIAFWCLVGVAIIIAAQFTTLKGIQSVKRVVDLKKADLSTLSKESFLYTDKLIDIEKTNEQLNGWKIGYFVMNLIGCIFIIASLSNQASDVLNPEYQAGVNIIRLASICSN